MSTLLGLRIVENPLLPATRPRVQLDPKVPLTDEFRAAYNRWLEDFFGSEAYILMLGGMIVTNPANAILIKAATRQ